MTDCTICAMGTSRRGGCDARRGVAAPVLPARYLWAIGDSSRCKTRAGRPDTFVARTTTTTFGDSRQVRIVYATNRTHLAIAELRGPSVPEQRAIATVLTNLGDEIAALGRRLDKTRAVKQGMMQQLVTGAVRLPIPDDGLERESHDA